jgi:hypothetical protein
LNEHPKDSHGNLSLDPLFADRVSMPLLRFIIGRFTVAFEYPTFSVNCVPCAAIGMSFVRPL